jgi:hypothetical protein
MLKENAASLETVLSTWEKNIGLPTAEPNLDAVNDVINISRDKLAEMTGREAAESAFIVSVLAMSIQYKYNQCKTLSRWCDANRNGFFGDDKSRLYNMKQNVELKMSRIEFMAKRLEFISQCLMSVQRSRFGESAK